MLYYYDMLCRAPAKRYAKIGVLAGLAGGLAEVIWIVLFSNLTLNDVTLVATGITQSVGLWQVATSARVPLGIAIHMSLAVILGISISIFLSKLEHCSLSKQVESLIVICVLAIIWGINFFFILPAINPAFVNIVPLPVSFLSKIIFGFAAAWVFFAKHKSNLTYKF
jgi:membrane-associated HD superfamily phosphohydrolase